MTAFAKIWNLADLSIWTAGGSNAKPQVSWVASDADGDSIGTHRVRCYDSASGGTKVYDSGTIAGNPGFHNVNWGVKNLDQSTDSLGASYHGPEMWATVEVTDAKGESSGESSRRAFKVAWGQAIYEFNAGTSSNAWDFTHATLPANTDAAFLFAEADSNGANRGPLKTSAGAAHTAKDYVNIVVRLATYSPSVQPALADMTFTYQPLFSGQPDNWARSPGATPEHWQLDSNTRRYGNKCYRCVVQSAAYHYIEPYRLATGDGVVVTPNTDYVFSVFVKTSLPLTTDHYIVLQVRDTSDNVLATGQLFGDVFADGPGATSDTSLLGPNGRLLYPEGWQRLHLHFQTDLETVVRPLVLYLKSVGGVVATPDNTGDTFWIDAAKWEEGTVVSAWSPGFASEAMVMDSWGITIDAVAGAKFALRKDGTTGADLDQIVDAATHIIVGSGSPEGVYTARQGTLYLRDDGGSSTTLYYKPNGGVVSPTSTGWVAVASSGGGGGASLEVKEVDGSPDVATVSILRFTNSHVTNDGGGQVTVTIPTVHADLLSIGANDHHNQSHSIIGGDHSGFPGGTTTFLRADQSFATPLRGSATGWVGDGSDGNMVLDGTNTFSFLNKAVNVYSMTRDIFANNLTIDSGKTLITAGYRVYVLGTLTVNGILTNAGGDASGATAGTTPLQIGSPTTGGGQAGAGGRLNSSGVGNSTATLATQAVGGQGGSGGSATSAGGTAGTVGPTRGGTNWRTLPWAVMGNLSGTTAGSGLTLFSGGTGGGSGGSNSSTTTSSGGGGGGGGVVIICATTIIVGASGVITAAGGNGGNASGTGAAGGGGGGGGGAIVLLYEVLTNSGSITVAAGIHGNGVNGGNNGVDGSAGTLLQFAMVA